MAVNFFKAETSKQIASLPDEVNADTRLEVVLRRHFSGFGLDEGRVHAQVLSVPGAFLKKINKKQILILASYS